MAPNKTQSSGLSPAVMIGAGLCAALLITVARQGTPQAVALSHFAPLPIMISTLGFGPAIGFGAAMLAAVTVALLAAIHEGPLSLPTLFDGLVVGAIVAIYETLPAWWLSLLGCLARPEGVKRWTILKTEAKRPPLPEFYPIGGIVTQAAFIVIALICAAVAIIIEANGGPSVTLDKLVTKVQPLTQDFLASSPWFGRTDAHTFTERMVEAMPAVMAAWTFLVLLGNLWLAGRVVQTSNRLRRPWPDIARELRISKLLIIVLLAAALLCLLPNAFAIGGLIAVATLSLAYALQGIAVMHDLSRGWRWRILMLFVVYLALIVFVPWPLAIFALLGLADATLSLRARKHAALVTSKS